MEQRSNNNSSSTDNNGSGDTSPTPNRGATSCNDGSSASAAPFPGGGPMMNINPMAFMAQFPGMMGNMPNMANMPNMSNMPNMPNMPNNAQDMMNMMAYCQTANGFGMGNNMGAFAGFNNNVAPNQNSQAQGRHPQAQHMAEIMLGKRRMDGVGEDGGHPPAAKRANPGPSPAADGTVPIKIETADATSTSSGGNAGEKSPVASADNPDSDSKPADSAADSPPSSPSDVVPVPASEEGIKFYSRNDVLCGRGGGTNVHPGNRRFRDLINTNRRAYLKARKNDKPAISRSIVRTIRENNGRFLKKDEKRGLWLEIGDDSAREKTSQALRQRAPEMRKILFEDEQRNQQQQQMMQHQQLMGMAAGQGMQGMQGMGGNFAQMPAAVASMAMGGNMGGNMGNNMGGNMGGNMGNFAAAMGGGNQAMGDNGNNPQALLAKYNMLHQNNWLAQEKNMLMQRLAMSGINPNAVNNLPNNNADNTILQQGIKSSTPRIA